MITMIINSSLKIMRSSNRTKKWVLLWNSLAKTQIWRCWRRTLSLRASLMINMTNNMTHLNSSKYIEKRSKRKTCKIVVRAKTSPRWIKTCFISVKSRNQKMIFDCIKMLIIKHEVIYHNPCSISKLYSQSQFSSDSCHFQWGLQVLYRSRLDALLHKYL